MEPSPETSEILSSSELKLLTLVLDACKQAENVQLPISTAADQRRVQRIAEALGVTEARLLAEWGRAGLHGPSPQVQFSHALYTALFEWALDRVNYVLNSTLTPLEGESAWLTVACFPEAEGQHYAGFASFIANEALAQWCAELLPLHSGSNPSMRPAAHELSTLE